ncbi:MAG: hypothetical protein M1821_008377 [Bathelium mastoideum]|nr:MAG: hypothetical protein M1821_008377 [Bathelium mastoideum]
MAQKPYGGRGPLVVGVIKHYGLDDVFTIIAWILLLMYGVMVIIAAAYGFGNHLSDLLPQEAIQSNLYEIIGQTIWLFTMPVCIGAVIFLLLRIFRTIWHRYVLYGVFGTLWIAWSWLGFTEWLQCYPFKHTYDSTIKATCWLSSQQYIDSAFVVSSWAIFIDIFLVVFPIHIIWQLHAGKRERLTIIVLLSGGVFSAICGIMKTIQVSELSAKADYTYGTVPLILWSNTESRVTIIMACIPPMQPILTKWIFGRHRAELKHG